MAGLLLSIFIAFIVDLKIDSVIVYPTQALVIRKGILTLQEKTTLTFKDLSGLLDDNSVRIKAEGLKIGEVKIKRGYLEIPPPIVKELEKKIRDLEMKIRELNDEKAVLKAQDEFLSSIKLASPEIISKELLTGKIAPEGWSSALRFVSSEFVRVKTRQAKIDDELKELNKQLEALKRELADAKAISENRKEISCEIDVPKPGDYEIELSYVIPHSVFWHPYYELRAKPKEGKVKIDYFAKVQQKTAEDWTKVKITLSTAKPALAGVPPQPSPWYLRLEEPIVYKERAKLAEDAAFFALPQAAPQEAKRIEEVKMVETGLALQYIIPGRINLKSGEPEKKFPLVSISMPAEFEYYSFPKATDLVYLKGKMINNSPHIFLDGEGSTYVEDEYSGKTRVRGIAPQESLSLSFGVDERIKVEHKLVKMLTSRTGLFNKKERKEFLYETTIENYLPREAKLTIVEQVPISQDKEIVVKVTKLEPKPDTEDSYSGTFNFIRTLKPKEKFVINLGYFVEYPLGKKVIGL